MGGGIGMGNTCKPMAVSFQCMTKSTTIKRNKVVTIMKKKDRKVDFMTTSLPQLKTLRFRKLKALVPISGWDRTQTCLLIS